MIGIDEIAFDLNEQLREAKDRASRWPVPFGALPSEALVEIRGLSAQAVQAGRLELAYFLQGIADMSPSSGQDTRTITFRSGKDVDFRLHQLNAPLKLLGCSDLISEGRLPATFDMKSSCEYLLQIVTSADCPLVRYPLLKETPDVVDLPLHEWCGLGSAYALLTNPTGHVGDDLGARNPLDPEMMRLNYSLAVMRYPVSMLAYLDFVDASGSPLLVPSYMGVPLVERSAGQWKSSSLKYGLEELPVVGVDFDCALGYAEWLSSRSDRWTFRLPKDYEWELAARGPGSWLYPWGDHFDRRLANTKEGGMDELREMGTWAGDESIWGIRDLAGNAEEWCAGEGGPSSGPEPVARGGSYYNLAQAARGASRVERKRDYRHNKLTFRMCAEVA